MVYRRVPDGPTNDPDPVSRSDTKRFRWSNNILSLRASLSLSLSTWQLVKPVPLQKKTSKSLQVSTNI